jgi:hypothetical protein
VDRRSVSVSIYYVRDIARVKYILHLTYSIVQRRARAEPHPITADDRGLPGSKCRDEQPKTGVVQWEDG